MAYAAMYVNKMHYVFYQNQDFHAMFSVKLLFSNFLGFSEENKMKFMHHQFFQLRFPVEKPNYQTVAAHFKVPPFSFYFVFKVELIRKLSKKHVHWSQ